MDTPPAARLSLVRSLRFCAGHRLYRHEGKCAFLHGHNYRADVEVEAVPGRPALDDVGRVVDFALIKRRMLGWIDEHWDHAFILFVEDETALAAVRAAVPTKYFVLPWNPTAENMARYLLEIVAPAVLGDLAVVARRVVVWETDDACAVASATGTLASPASAPGTAVVIDHRP